jgi:hypothetical protein
MTNIRAITSQIEEGIQLFDYQHKSGYYPQGVIDFLETQWSHIGKLLAKPEGDYEAIAPALVEVLSKQEPVQVQGARKYLPARFSKPALSESVTRFCEFIDAMANFAKTLPQAESLIENVPKGLLQRFVIEPLIAALKQLPREARNPNIKALLSMLTPLETIKDKIEASEVMAEAC